MPWHFYPPAPIPFTFICLQMAVRLSIGSFLEFFFRSQKRDAYEYYQVGLLVPGFIWEKVLQLLIFIWCFPA